MYDQTYDCVGVFHNISKLSIFESHKSYVGDADLSKISAWPSWPHK
jgi:hypothetical protein